MAICGKEYQSKSSIARRDDNGGDRTASRMDNFSKEVIQKDSRIDLGMVRAMTLETDNTFNSHSVISLDLRHDTIIADMLVGRF